MWIIISGNPVDGFTYAGPFESHDNAIDWARENCERDDWWIVQLGNPEGHITQ